MKQVLDFLKIEKLGTPLATPIEKFEGRLPALIVRNDRTEEYAVVKWNDEISAPDVVYDPNASKGIISQIKEVYSLSVSEDDGKNGGVNEPSEFDTITVAKIKEELAGRFELKTTVLNGKNKAELYEMLVGLRAEADDDQDGVGAGAGDGGNEGGSEGGNPVVE